MQLGFATTPRDRTEGFALDPTGFASGVVLQGATLEVVPEPRALRVLAARRFCGMVRALSVVRAAEACHARAMETLELERAGALLPVWLARPARLNALNGEALAEIEQLFTRLQTDFATRVVVLGGRGPSFCAGADRGDPPGSDGWARLGRERARAAPCRAARAARLRGDRALEAVTIARLHGHVLGGGLALALACDSASRPPERASGSPRWTSACRSPGARAALVHESARRGRGSCCCSATPSTPARRAHRSRPPRAPGRRRSTPRSDWAARLAAKPGSRCT